MKTASDFSWQSQGRCMLLYTALFPPQYLHLYLQGLSRLVWRYLTWPKRKVGVISAKAVQKSY